MGDSIKDLYEDYDYYKSFCEKLNEEPRGIREKCNHERELLKKHGYKIDGGRYVKDKKAERVEKFKNIKNG